MPTVGLVAELDRRFPRFVGRQRTGDHPDGGKRPPPGGRSDLRSIDPTAQGFPTAGDRVEVQPWIEKEERFSFVSSDPRAVDLACFSDLEPLGGAA